LQVGGLTDAVKDTHLITYVQYVLESDVKENTMNSSDIRSIMMMMMMMMMMMILETSFSYRHLTWLISREDFIEFSRHESKRSYINEDTLFYKPTDGRATSLEVFIN
jgi:hypothetical protein